MPDIITSTTQQFLDIHDITNNFVIMKDGTISVVLTVNAMNFGLLAEEEQDAVMYAYAGLLNSLNYPIQIIVNSTTKDVTAYLQLLQDQEQITVNETLRRRISIYREFVANLIQERNVLDKKFYVSIPANAVELGLMGAATVLPGKTKLDITSVERSILLEKAQNLLEPKRDHLIAQFARIGLFSRQLSTQEIIQLFYIRYNPEAAEGQQIGESSSYTSPLVQASIQGSVMNNPIDPNQTPGMPQAQTNAQSPMGEISQPPQIPTPEAPPVTPMPDVPAPVPPAPPVPSMPEQPMMPPAPPQTPLPEMPSPTSDLGTTTPPAEAPSTDAPSTPPSILPEQPMTPEPSSARPNLVIPGAPTAALPDTPPTPNTPPSLEPTPSMTSPMSTPSTQSPTEVGGMSTSTPPEPTSAELDQIQAVINQAAQTPPNAPMETPSAPPVEPTIPAIPESPKSEDGSNTPPVPTL